VATLRQAAWPHGLRLRTDGDVFTKALEFLKVTAIYQFVIGKGAGCKQLKIHILIIAHLLKAMRCANIAMESVM